MNVVFVIGTGRSGTLAISQALGLFTSITAHHEYLFEPVLRQALLYHLGKSSHAETLEFLRENYLPAIAAGQGSCWVDCSNALPWLVGPLAELLPQARFVFVARHGRRVVSSFYHKFQRDMYADDCVEQLYAYLRDEAPLPPAHKRFWRPVPLPGSADYEWFSRAPRFDRLCYYWQATTAQALESLTQHAVGRHEVFNFEAILAEPAAFARFLAHFPLPSDGAGKVEAFFKRPVNVAEPKTYALTSEEQDVFARICAPMMTRLSYPLDSDYVVRY
jgi:hypothetical protein